MTKAAARCGRQPGRRHVPSESREQFACRMKSLKQAAAAATGPTDVLFTVLSPTTMECTEHDVERFYHNRSHWLVERGSGCTLGCALVTRPAAVLDLLWVHPDWRGRGLAQVLLETVLRESAADGWELLTFDCLPCLVPFYTKYGARRLDGAADRDGYLPMCFTL